MISLIDTKHYHLHLIFLMLALASPGGIYMWAFFYAFYFWEDNSSTWYLSELEYISFAPWEWVSPVKYGRDSERGQNQETKLLRPHRTSNGHGLHYANSSCFWVANVCWVCMNTSGIVLASGLFWWIQHTDQKVFIGLIYSFLQWELESERDG